MAESLKNKTFKGTIWSAIDSFSTQGIQFIITLVMARILTPADYGVVGMLSIFIGVCNAFIVSGFTQALVRKQDRTEVDNCTVFYFNIVVAAVLYITLFFCAPLIARFYDMPILVPVTRAVSLGMIFGSFNVVQRAQFTIKLDFKTTAKISLTSIIISGAVGITLAYTGFGVWALVIQNLTGGFIGTVLLWFWSNWRPKLLYSWKSFHEMFSFGSKLLASSLLDTLYTNIYSLVIGKVYKASDLGLYNRALGFSQIASTNVTSVIQRVTYPVLCTIQNEEERLREGYRRLLRVSAFIIFPIMMGLGAVGKPMILTLLNEKWLYSAVLLIPICFAGMWYPVHAINLNLLQVKGRSDLFLRLEIIKKIVGVSILCITIPMGLYAMCWGSVCSSIIALVINTHYTGKLLNLGFILQMKDLLPVFILSVSMGVAVWLTMSYIPFPNPALFAIGILEGAMIYIGLAKLLRFGEFKEITQLMRRR